MKLNRLFSSYWKMGCVVGIGAAAMSIAECARAGCGAVGIETLSASATKRKCGLGDFDCQTNFPPDFFLKETHQISYRFNVSNTDFDYIVHDCWNPVSLTSSDVNSAKGDYNEKVVKTYDPFSCQATMTYSGSASYTDTAGVTSTGQITNSATGDWDDNKTNESLVREAPADYFYGEPITNIYPPCSSVLLYFPQMTCSVAEIRTNCEPWYNCGTITYHNGSLNTEETFYRDIPYDDPALRTDTIRLIPPYPTNADGTLAWCQTCSNSAYYHLTPDHITDFCSRMMYRLKITDFQPKQTYWITWQEVTVPDNGGPTTNNITPIEITTGADPNQPYYYPSSDGQLVDVPKTPCTIFEQNPTITNAPPGTSGSGGPK